MSEKFLLRSISTKRLKRVCKQQTFLSWGLSTYNQSMRLIFPVLLLVAAVAKGEKLDLKEGVIVHLFEWRWEDIASECEEFLNFYGYKAIQISPPSENLITPNRNWWERYQPLSYKLETRSGNEEQFKDMVTRCNDVGVRVFADVVLNHMTGDWDDCRGTGGSTCDTKTLSYPGVPYSKEHFHTECDIKNYNDADNVRSCKLLGLHDLNQSTDYVKDKIVDYLNNLIDIGVSGFRIDAAKHMSPADLQAIFGRLKNLNTEYFPENTFPYIYQEVIDKTGKEGVKFQEYTSSGLVTDFRFGKELGRAFQGLNDLKWLKTFGSAWNLLPENESIVFIENHNTERDGDKDILNYKRHEEYKMTISFMLAWGYSQPKILSSFKFDNRDAGPPHDDSYNILSPHPIEENICSNGWVCQHRWRQIYNMVNFHNIATDLEVTNWWDNGKNQIAFCKGNKGFIAFNSEKYALNQKLQTCLPEGVYCDIISGTLLDGKCTGKSVNVESDGLAQIEIPAFDKYSLVDGVLAIHAQSKTFEIPKDHAHGRPPAA